MPFFHKLKAIIFLVLIALWMHMLS